MTDNRPAKRRSLWPREHGAYAQLAAPIVTALVLGELRAPALLLASAAVAAFLANEPLLVVLGHRGARLAASHGPRARRRLALLTALGAGAGIWGLLLAPSAAIRISAVCAVPIVALLVLAWRRGQHSVAGELVAAIALPAASAPIAVAAGIPWDLGIVLWIAWSIGYASTVVAVHRVIARHRRPPTRADRALVTSLGVLALAIVGVGIALPALLLAIPLVAVSEVLVLRPPPASRLRTIGVVLVLATVAAIAIAIATALDQGLTVTYWR
jgi:hypothetical protein